MKTKLILIQFVLAACWFTPKLNADIFNVTDADFVGGVYEFRYYSTSNKVFVNGTEVSYSSLVMTSDGVTGPVAEGGGKYWEATGHFGALQLAGDLTMGWDFSAVSLNVNQVELLTNAAIFQFNPWAPHAFEDIIFGEIATPGSFGGSAYDRYFEYEGDNNGAIGAYSNVGLIQDVTSLVDNSWLSNPDLFELRLGYQQHAIDGAHPNIPGKHIQFFRDGGGGGDQSFLFRVTSNAIPEPSGILLLGGLAGLVAFRRRKR